jgi:hypothetical protein
LVLARALAPSTRLRQPPCPTRGRPGDAFSAVSPLAFWSADAIKAEGRRTRADPMHIGPDPVPAPRPGRLSCYLCTLSQFQALEQAHFGVRPYPGPKPGRNPCQAAGRFPTRAGGKTPFAAEPYPPPQPQRRPPAFSGPGVPVCWGSSDKKGARKQRPAPVGGLVRSERRVPCVAPSPARGLALAGLGGSPDFGGLSAILTTETPSHPRAVSDQRQICPTPGTKHPLGNPSCGASVIATFILYSFVAGG